MPGRYPPAWICPVNQARCGHICWVRHACQTNPDGVRRLLARVDQEVARALAPLIPRKP